ncbi:MAG: GAF domain-containing sensor histidine kinase [Chloroflexota bacterium]
MMKSFSIRWFQQQNRPSKELQLLRLNRLLTELGRTNSIETILDTVLESIQVSLQGDASALYLLGEDGKTVEQTLLHGVSTDYAEKIADDYRGLPGETVLITRQAVCIENVTKNPDYGERLRFLQESGWTALYAFPILVKDEAIGAMVVYYHKTHRGKEQELQLGMAYASIVGMGLQNSRYAGELKRYAIDMSQRVRKRTAELQRAKERIEAILSSIPDAIFVIENNTLSMANQAGHDLLAQATGEQINLFDKAWLQRLEEQQAPSEKDVIQIGGRFYQALASPLNFGDRNEGLVTVYRNVTRFRELDQLKTQFVSDVSHELRTPLANLTLYLDLLANIQDPERQNNYMQVLQRETSRLTRLIEDLLTISRLEAERVRVNIKRVELHRMLTELAYDRGLMASGQGLTLLYEPGGQPPSIHTDPELLNQCLSNLLTNAINYTPPGGTIRLICSQEKAADGWLLVKVADNGVGILPEELSQIFKRFFRGAASRQTSAPGTGLGLSISKEILERMGGNLTVESTPGQGSTFTIWLPMRP